MTSETLVDTSKIDPDDWQTFEKFELKQYVLWEHPETGGSIALLDFPKGSGIPEKHSHASNQFMYCLQGRYEYTDSNMELTPGSFYSNPKDHPHGPTIAHERSILLEIYDGPHYYEMPEFHTDSTIGRIDSKSDAGLKTYLVVAMSEDALLDEDDQRFIRHQQFVIAHAGETAGLTGILCDSSDTQSSGVTYPVTATDLKSAEAIVSSDPLHAMYTNVAIHRVK